MLKQEAGEIQKELYSSTQDMQMRTTYSQLHPDIEKGSPSEHGSVWHIGSNRGSFVWEQVQHNWGLLLLSSFRVCTALIPRDALCTVTGKRYWNSE